MRRMSHKASDNRQEEVEDALIYSVGVPAAYCLCALGA